MKGKLRIIALASVLTMSMSCFAFAAPSVTVNADKNTGKVTIEGTANKGRDVNVTIEKEGKLYYIDTAKADESGEYSFKTEVPKGMQFDVNVTSNKETSSSKIDMVSSGGGSSSGGSSSGGGASGGGALNPPTNNKISKPVIEHKPVAGNIGTESTVSSVTTEITAKQSKSGKTEAQVGKETISAALDTAIKAAKEAEKQGKNKVKAEVKLEVKAATNATTVETKLPVTSIRDIAKKQNSVLTVDTPLGSVSFDNEALSVISDNASAGKNVSIILEKASKNEVLKGVSAENEAKIKKTIGNRAIVSLSVSVDGKNDVGNFGNGAIKAGISYNLARGEKAAGVVVFYIDDSGKMTPMSTIYNAATKKAFFDTNHFSYYAVGYDEAKAISASQFIDVKETDWFSVSVNYLVERDIINGKSADLFAPKDNITRAEFIAILSRMSGDEILNTTEKFSDVKDTVWYAKAVAWATEKGIAKGTSETTFAPNAKISRQDMSVMLMNYVNYKKLTLEKKNQFIKFADEDNITSYAKTAVAEMQQAGIINGVIKNGVTSFNPKNKATRAEATKMIYEIVK